ncbi:MAG: FAD binding domain-containing protein [Hansschlegelia sp.]
MIPLDFDYARPATVAEALGLLATPGAIALAGGQTLLPLLSERGVEPTLLVDIGRLSDLRGVGVADGVLTIGAGATLTDAMSPVVADAAPLLFEALPSVGSLAVRNRGTLVGNLVRASPSSELPVVMVALGARFVLRSTEAERVVEAEAFFVDAHETALRPGELVTAIRIPIEPRESVASAFAEISSRAGAPPLCCVAALLTVEDDSVVREARIAAGGLSGAPTRCVAFEAAAVGHPLSECAARMAGIDDLPPASLDLPEADYARDVLPVLVGRAVSKAAARFMERQA